MPTIEVLVPTIGRADRLSAVAANVHDATEAEHRVVFIVEEHDETTVLAARATGELTLVNEHSRNYAGAVQTGYERTDGRYLFCGSDDLRFHRGWDRHALDTMTALPHVRVVGTNDLLNPYVAQGLHATHSLTDRRYLDEVGGVVDGGPGSFLNTMFDHQFTDTEYIGTAKARAVFAPCMASVVEHMHFMAGKSEHDGTYERAYAELAADETLYESRKHLWWGLSR